MTQENGKRRRWTAKRKLEVVLEGLSEKVTIAELCRKHGITQSMYYDWKQLSLQKMEEALTFAGKTKEEYEKDKKIQTLECKIGQLTMDNEILKKTQELIARRRQKLLNLNQGASL